ncbi:hypothetical protein GO491_11790 [Flavobacteriaceae bacterium Ap0902]|nr:hypothetical protein [Flavobacteriaceae bacterium Ap0902]
MSCNCKKIDNFKHALNQAKRLTKNTGVQHVVFKVNFQGKETATYGTVESAEKSGACCYYTTEGKEIKISKPTPKKTTKKVEDKK